MREWKAGPGKASKHKTKHKIVHVLFSAMLRLGFPRKTYKNMEVTMLQFSTKVSKHFGKIQDLIMLKHLLGFCWKANQTLHSAVLLGEIMTGYKKLRGRAHHSFLLFHHSRSHGWARQFHKCIFIMTLRGVIQESV